MALCHSTLPRRGRIQKNPADIGQGSVRKEYKLIKTRLDAPRWPEGLFLPPPQQTARVHLQQDRSGQHLSTHEPEKNIILIVCHYKAVGFFKKDFTNNTVRLPTDNRLV